MRIGFIGLGNMGRHMAANLQRAGHELVVHDVRREAAEGHLANGARWAASPAEAAQGAELILTSLPGPKQVEAVALGEGGILQGAARDAVYADLSTSSPTLIRRIYQVFREQGIHVLDAPVSGGPLGAERATLQVMVGGDEAIYERVRPALLGIGDKVSYIGEIGAGEIAKLCHNTLGYCANVALAEVFTLGVKAGVSPEKLLEAIKGGAYGQGYMLSHRLPNLVFKGAFDQAGFYLALARKDVGLTTELARELDVPMTMASLAEQALIEGLARGWADKDSSAIWMLQEERAGVTVRTSAPDHSRGISDHYASADAGGILAVILDGLRAAGKDLDRLTTDDLAPIDQFHSRGKPATVELAQLAGLRGDERVLDVGGGLGGPARTLAAELGCSVTVLDLTAAYCQAGERLTELTGLTDRVSFQHGSAFEMPFEEASFDVAWTQHSSMNMEDKERLYAEIRRVLRPGGTLALHEFMAGPIQPVHYPVPWAADPSISFLRPPEEIRALLRGLGFVEKVWIDAGPPALAWFRERAATASPTPAPLGLHLLLGPRFGAAIQNVLRNLEEQRLALVQAVFERQRP